MTIKTDVNSITKSHNKYVEIKNKTAQIETLETFIFNINNMMINLNEPMFDSLVFVIEDRNNFITDLWNDFKNKQAQLNKTKETFEAFFKEARQEYSVETLEAQLEKSMFTKTKAAIVAELVDKGDDDLEFWIALSKASKTAIKGLIPARKTKQ